MVSKKEAQTLRGLISWHVQCEKRVEVAGAYPPADAEFFREQAKRAHQAVYAYIANLTERGAK